MVLSLSISALPASKRRSISLIFKIEFAALGKELQRVLRKQGFEFFFSHRVKSAKTKGKEVIITADNEKGEEVQFKGDYCLVSVGRKAYTEGLGIENIYYNV